MPTSVVILSAGAGTRMRSEKPKVLHKVGGKYILQHIIDAAKSINPKQIIVVIGFLGDVVQNTINAIYPGNDFVWVTQEKQLGTAHALASAYKFIHSDCSNVVLMCGDVPLIQTHTISTMLNMANNGQNFVVLGAAVDNPYGYGRLKYDNHHKLASIVEQKDLDDKDFTNQINAGTYVIPYKHIETWINRVGNNNSQHEYYVTDFINFAYSDQVPLEVLLIKDSNQIHGINSKKDLEEVERCYQLIQSNTLIENGVHIVDKNRIDIRTSELTIGNDVVIDINCILEGQIKIGCNVVLGAGSIITNSTIGNNVTIKPYSVIDGANIGDNCVVGPFARIRPDTFLNQGAHIGNFVEIKKSTIGTQSKVNHLSYIGDTIMGSKVNVGAGSVTCNYDGIKKHQTIIEDGAFVGSGTMMVAPVTLESGSVVGAGSTITKRVPKNSLTLSRSVQRSIDDWNKGSK